MGTIRFGSLAVIAALTAPVAASADVTDGRGDVTVIAVIDDGFSPYHYDWLASQMPQHLDADPSNDLPLDESPETWLPGFSSYVPMAPLHPTLPDDPADSPATLGGGDAAVWAMVQQGQPYFVPGTKIVTAIAFGQGLHIYGSQGNHGVGTSSVSAGNVYGSCPECVIVLLQYGTQAGQEAAIRWATNQSWIDAITNSYGFSTGNRDNITFHSQPEVTRKAVERGQAIFWSAGNGQENAFVVPVTTQYSSDKGPDWVIQVGAISPSGSSYSGAGKTVDIAGIGSAYPSSYGATNAVNGASFSGTSNATPTLAGTYARALYLARRALGGSSTMQSDHAIAVGDPVVCGSARPYCELGDGVLTSIELRQALFDASVRTPNGMNVGGTGDFPAGDEVDMANEGYGGWFVRQKRNDALWLAEFDRLWRPLIGEAAYPSRPVGEHDWMVVDSYCRQQLWGDWSEGSFVRGETALPGSDPAWPVRSAYEQICAVHPKLPPNRNIP